MQLYNTLSHSKVEFKPIQEGSVKLYTCGPTVYHYAHIGNLRNLIFNDTLKRTLLMAGYKVNHVMNITDVGHLTSDGDTGDDKLEKGAKASGKTVWEVAEFYTKAFNQDATELNIIHPTKVVPATSAIDEQINLVQQLMEHGFAYQTSQAIYFDVTRARNYGQLTGQNLSDKEVGARKEVTVDQEKRHPYDFALWFFNVGHFSDHAMHWPSPWGKGFPGWHLECSAIVHKYLGETIDIHTGGVDHIGTHHTNEIAQSEAAFGKPLAQVWLHNEFLQLNGVKIAKSEGNSLTLGDLASRSYHPLAFRLLMLMSHYRSQQNFTWEALTAAQNSLLNLYAWSDLAFQNLTSKQLRPSYEKLYDQFKNAFFDDLNSVKALAHLSDFVNFAEMKGADSKTIELYAKELDHFLGLKLADRHDITQNQKDLIAKRESARRHHDWELSDNLREQLIKEGLEVSDTPHGSIWRRLSL